MEENNKQADNQEESPAVKELKEKLAKRESERDDYLNGWKRAKADLLNYKKEEAKRFEEIVNFGNLEFVKDFIPVLDSFDLALSVLEKEGKAERGIYMIRSQMEDVLKKRGLERIMVSPGDPFDPSRHESVGEVESGEPAGAIAAVIELGYSLNGRIIRPARVKLSRSKM